MTREQALNYMRSSGWSDEQIETVVGAFTCGDAISRQAVIDAIYACYIGGKEAVDKAPYSDHYAEGIDEAVNAVYELPSVTVQEKIGRWIPVSERLPEDHDWYLAVMKEKDTDYQLIPRVATYMYDGKWDLIDSDGQCPEWLDNLECIAWMPLPQPYKAESEDKE